MALSDNLVALWRFDTNASAQIDAVNSIVVTNSAPVVSGVPGRIGLGQSYAATGSYSLGLHNNNLDLVGSWSFGFWLKALSDTDGSFFQKKQALDTTTPGIIISKVASCLQVRWNDGENLNDAVSQFDSFALQPDQWYCFVINFDSSGSTCTLYIDAVEKSNFRTSFPVGANVENFFIGASSLESMDAVPGTYDLVSFWKGRTLSEDEILQFYNNGNGYDPLTILGGFDIIGKPVQMKMKQRRKKGTTLQETVSNNVLFN